jgi:hypothetical protein
MLDQVSLPSPAAKGKAMPSSRLKEPVLEVFERFHGAVPMKQALLLSPTIDGNAITPIKTPIIEVFLRRIILLLRGFS